MQAIMYNLAGEEVERIELDDAIFGVTPNLAVIQQAVLRQQANARQGTHETKTRADVRGGGRKPWRQKGTGRARQGSTRSPQWTKGGIVFGPHVRSYEQDMPRKMRRLAIRGVLSAKLAGGRLVLVDNLDEIEPRTKAMVEALGSLNVGTESALIMTTESSDNLSRAAGNLPRITLQHAGLLSIVDMLKHEFIIMPRASVELVQRLLSNGGGRRKFPLRGSTTATATPIAIEEAPAKAVSDKKAKGKKAAAEEAPAAIEAASAEAPTQEEASDTVEAAPKAKRPRKSKTTTETAEKDESAGTEDNAAFAPTARVHDAAEATMLADEPEATTETEAAIDEDANTTGDTTQSSEEERES